MSGIRLIFLLSCLAIIFFSLDKSMWAQAESIRITPQTVVDLTLRQGYRARSVEVTAQKAYVSLYKALGEFDLKLTLSPAYEYSETPNLMGTQNAVDRTTTFTSGLSKKFRTGSIFALEYSSVVQNATLASTTSTRAPDIALNSLLVSLRQNLWSNSFGYADRLAVEIADASIEAAEVQREYQLQGLILDALTLFWNTYSAERQLRENLAARDKYIQLVKSTRQKAGFNLSSPGELPRLEAELELSEQRVKASSSSYLNALTLLMSALRLNHEGKDTFEIVVPDSLPPVPRLPTVKTESTRPVRLAQLVAENANRNKLMVKSRMSPKFDFVGKGQTTGSGVHQSESFSKMQTGSKPYYYLGVEYATSLFGSNNAKSQITEANLALSLAENDLQIQIDSSRDQLIQLERSVASQYAIAKSAMETTELRSRVVRELEIAYRQGRQPLVELIRAYNELFKSQQDRATAIGQYHIYLNQFAAARDELISSAKK